MSRSLRTDRRAIVRPPPGHEIREINLLVEEYRSEIQKWNEKIEELLAVSDKSADVKVDVEALLKRAMARKEELDLLLTQELALISPVAHLPAEILALVMMCHVHENGHSPWELLAVSRSWRCLGLETPRLWSRIRVIKRLASLPWISSARLSSQHRTGGVLCKNKETWDLVLARSGVVSLDLIIECDKSMMEPDFLTKIILESGHRWQTLVCGIDEGAQEWNIEHQSLSFPKLQSAIFLQSCTGGPLTNAVLSIMGSTSAILRSLTVETERLVDALVSNPALLPRIKKFDVMSGNLLFAGLTEEVPVWSHLTRLEALVLRDGYSSVFSSDRDRFMSYKTLRILATRFLPIDKVAMNISRLKSLTHLYLEHPNPQAIGSPELHSIALPNVTHFHLVGASYAPLQWFLFPSLIVLELFGNMMSPSQANDEFDFVWNPETFGKAPSPSVLHIEVKANDAYLLMALRSMDHLRELHLYYDAVQSSPSKLMDSLAVKPKKSVVARGVQAVKKWVPPTCPELEVVSFVYRKLLKQDRADVNERLKRIYEARLGTACEMKELQALLRSESQYQKSNLAQRAMEDGVC